jgi:hypothetical protein
MQPEQNMTRDPGTATLDPHERTQLYKIKVPFKIYTLLANAYGVDRNNTGTDDDEGSRTELDTHANMPVVGRNAHVISDTGKVADVSPFTPDYEAMQIRVVDAAVKYDCQYTGTTYILVI